MIIKGVVSLSPIAWKAAENMIIYEWNLCPLIADPEVNF